MLKSKDEKPVTYVGYTTILKIESNYIILEKEQNLPVVENGGLFLKKN